MLYTQHLGEMKASMRQEAVCVCVRMCVSVCFAWHCHQVPCNSTWSWVYHIISSGYLNGR